MARRRVPRSGRVVIVSRTCGVSLLARTNSLLDRVGNLLANDGIRRCFRDGFSQKAAESAKFPAFSLRPGNSARREIGEFIHRQAAEEPTVGNGSMLEIRASCPPPRASRKPRLCKAQGPP